MSTEHTSSSAKHEHGTTTSYIIGFILSIVLTLNAYFLVVSKILSGNALLITILALGFAQMAVQLLFFLHLGRGPKPLYNVVFFFGTAGIIAITIGASLFIMHNLYRNMLPDEVVLKAAQEENISQVSGESTGACNQTKENHQVTIENGVASPATTEANRCDTLTFINNDNEKTVIVFGTPAQPESYGGEDSISAAAGYSKTITLNQSGSFSFYDANNSSLTGQFTVTE